MIYLFLQIWVWLVAAFALGWLAHCFLYRQKSGLPDAKVAIVDSSSASDNSSTSQTKSVASGITANSKQPSESLVSSDGKPLGFSSQPDQVDDLKRIKGVGGVIEETLHSLGIYQFSQIAEWNQENVSWVEGFLSFQGRIAREQWIEQAKTLAAGGTTEFANRVDKGDVDY